MLWDMKQDAFHMVASDGHRLAKSKLEIHLPKAMQIIVPRKTILELLRLLKKPEDYSVELALTNKQLCVKTPEYTLISRLIEGSFPDYNSFFIPASEVETAIIDRDLLKDSLSRMNVLLNERCPGIRLEFSHNSLKLQVYNLEQEEAEEELEIEYSPRSLEEKFVIAFNNEYLVQVLDALPYGKIQFTFSSPKNSVLIQHVSEHKSIYVIMPMRF